MYQKRNSYRGANFDAQIPRAKNRVQNVILPKFANKDKLDEGNRTHQLAVATPDTVGGV